MQLRMLVKSAYQIQKLRIQTGNRLVINFKAKLGLDVSIKADDEKNDKLAKKIIDQMKKEYKLIADAVVKHPSALKKEGTFKNQSVVCMEAPFNGKRIISGATEYALAKSYMDLYSTEENTFKALQPLVNQFPIWTNFMKDIRGCGPAMAAVIITYVDIRKAKYRSCLEAYAGIDVAADGKGRSNKAAHLIDREYIDAEGNTQTKKSVTYNPFLKTKLLGVLTMGLLIGGGKYRLIYDNSKTQLEARQALLKDAPKDEQLSKLHIHRMAVRRMIKYFLHDLYEAWRPLEGLEVYPSYYEGKLGGEKHHEGKVRTPMSYQEEIDTDNPFGDNPEFEI